MMSIHCKQEVTTYHNNWPSSHQCTRKAVVDGYCKQHHPDAVKKRREESDRKFAEKLARDPRVMLTKDIKRAEAAEKLLALAEEALRKSKNVVEQCFGAEEKYCAMDARKSIEEFYRAKRSIT